MIQNSLPLHPGKVLTEFYMAEMDLNQRDLAERCGCSPLKISEIINGKRRITPSFAITLESVIGTGAAMWVRMQAEHDLSVARQEVG